MIKERLFYTYHFVMLSSGDTSRTFPLQFGSINPGIVNELQVKFFWEPVIFVFVLFPVSLVMFCSYLVNALWL